MTSDEQVKQIKKELKEKYPDNTYPSYIAEYIYFIHYLKQNKDITYRSVGKSCATVLKRIDNNIKEYLNHLKMVEFDELKDKIETLAIKATDKLENLMDFADKDTVKLRAAELILKQRGLIEDKQKIEVDGGFNVTVVEPPEAD